MPPVHTHRLYTLTDEEVAAVFSSAEAQAAQADAYAEEHLGHTQLERRDHYVRQIRRALHACSEDCIADAVAYGAEHLPAAEAARRVRALRAACRQAEVAHTAAMSLADRAAHGDSNARGELPGALRDLERTAALQRQHDFIPVSSMRALLEGYIAGDFATLDEYGSDLDGTLARLRDSHGAEAGGKEVELMEFSIVW